PVSGGVKRYLHEKIDYDQHMFIRRGAALDIIDLCVKRYLHEKIDYIQSCTATDKHVLIIPGAKTGAKANGHSRIYTIRSPLVSRTAQYRALLNLRAVEQTLKREQPDIIESGDPYQLGWRAVKVGRALKIPVIGF